MCHTTTQDHICFGEVMPCCFGLFCRKGVPLWLVGFACVVVIQMVTVTPIFAVAYSMAGEQLEAMFWQFSWAIQEKISSKTDDIIESCILPAREIQYYDSYLQECDIPITGDYWPEALIQNFNAHTTATGPMLKRFDLESLGIIKRTSQSQNVKTEYTWEIAQHPNCTKNGLAYAYVYSDKTTNLKMIGVCGMRDGNITGPLVIETDAPRLSPVEEAIFDGVEGTAQGAFLPIEFSWINPGTFTLIYEMPYRCGNSSQVYATTYAEKSLFQIDEILRQSAEEEKGSIYYIVEIQTNYLVASSLPNQTVSFKEDQPSRVMFFDAPNLVMRESAWYLKSRAGAHGLRYFDVPNSYRYKSPHQDMIIYTHPYRSAAANANGIEWLVVMVIPAEVVYGKINSMAGVAITVFCVGSLLGVIVSLFMVRILTRAIHTAIVNDEGIELGDSCIAEIRAIRDNIKNGNARNGDILLTDHEELMVNGDSGGEKKD